MQFSDFAKGSLGMIALLFGGEPALPQTFDRLEIHSFQSATPTNKQFLTGEANVKPALLSAELRIPKPGSAKLPAIVLIHDSGVISSSHDRWAQALNAIGVAVLVVDSFTGRGIVRTIDDQSLLDPGAMMIDAYRALALLAQHQRIDSSRIAVIGFSKGAMAAVYSSNQRFRTLYGPANLEFAAHIGLYTPCYVTYSDDPRVTGKPIRLFHGVADDFLSIVPCRAYVERLKRVGANVSLTEYAGAHHLYDDARFVSPLRLPFAPTPRNCLVHEGDNGQLLNSKTGQPFDPAGDPCIERGATLAYNGTAHEASMTSVKEFLTTNFGLNR